MKTETKQYCAIDAAKFVMSLLIVAIHAEPLSSVNSTASYVLTEIICKIAVPYFFTASGFLLFKKFADGGYDRKEVTGFVTRILRLYGLWMILLFFCDCGPLWFLGSLAIAVCLTAVLLERCRGTAFIAAAAALLYILGAMYITYPVLLNAASANFAVSAFIRLNGYLSAVIRNGFFMGFPYVALGMLFAYGRIHIPDACALAGLALSAALLFAEGIFVKNLGGARDTTMYFSLVPLTLCLFTLTLRADLPESGIYKKLRTDSMLIYYTHMAFIYLYDRLIAGASVGRYAFALAMSLISAVLIRRLSEKKDFGLMKLLYE